VRGTTVERTEDAALPDGLRAHWRAWLGAADDDLAVLGRVHDGPPPVVVVGAEGRTRPGWDGEVHAVTGIIDPAGAAVVSVPPAHVAWARSYVAQAGGTPVLIPLLDAESERTGVERTAVTFRPLGPDAIDRYLATGEWRGRAGGYAVQGHGEALVASIEGDYWNVVGLPVSLLFALRPELKP